MKKEGNCESSNPSNIGGEPVLSTGSLPSANIKVTSCEKPYPPLTAFVGLPKDKLKDAGHELNNCKFYHGVQTKDDILPMMKDREIGDYLIRSSLLRTEVALVLYLCTKVSQTNDPCADIQHYMMEFDEDNKFFINFEQKPKEDGKVDVYQSKKFKKYSDLVHHFTKHRLPCGVRLKKPVLRPHWQLKHADLIFDEEGRIGAGNFCVVYKGRATLRKDGNKSDEMIDVAIKKAKMAADTSSTVLMENRNALFAEAKTMIHYKHANVIQLVGLVCDMPPFLVAIEFCAGGCLESMLYKFGKEMEEFENQTILIDAARGMRYLHTQKCVHRDLASRNCLISADGLVKIADFGLSRTLAANETAFKEALKEAPLVWMAPECIQKESEFSTKTDVWAFGVVMHEIYYQGAKPFADEKETNQIAKSIKRAKMPSIEAVTKVPKMVEIQNLIWQRKPDDRPDFQRLLELLIDALVAHTPDDVKKMQINKLPGVTRKNPPSRDYQMDDVVVDPEKGDFSDRKKTLRKGPVGEVERAESERRRTTTTTKRGKDCFSPAPQQESGSKRKLVSQMPTIPRKTGSSKRKDIPSASTKLEKKNSSSNRNIKEKLAERASKTRKVEKKKDSGKEKETDSVVPTRKFLKGGKSTDKDRGTTATETVDASDRKKASMKRKKEKKKLKTPSVADLSAENPKNPPPS